MPRNVIANLFASVDGYASDAPDEEMTWVVGNFGEELGAKVGAEMDRTDTVLLGSVTWRILAAHWPDAELTGDEPDETTQQMNDMQKVVFSKSISDDEAAQWNNTRVVRGDLAEEVARLKAQDTGKDIGVSGSVEVVRSLLRAGLVDRLVLLVHPVILGDKGGKAIFGDLARTDLQLASSEVLDGRVVALEYRPAAA